MICYIFRTAGPEVVMSVFTGLSGLVGTEEHCIGKRLPAPIRKAELGRDGVFSRHDPLACPWMR